MGIEIEVNSLEDMCLLMCDNVLPNKKARGATDNSEHAPNHDRNIISNVTGDINKLPGLQEVNLA